MNLRRLLTAVLLLSAGIARTSAHNVRPEPVVEVFVKPTGDHVTVQLRLPIAVLADANLPRNPDGRLAQNDIAQALNLVARGIARDLEFQQGDDLLAMSAVSASLSADEELALIDLDYLIGPDRSPLSARLRPFRAGGQVVRTDAHYIVDARAPRTFRIAGEPERVTFEPAPTQVLGRFIRRGIEVLLSASDYFLFALCLIAPLRSRRAFLGACTALLAGQAIGIVSVSVGRLPVTPAVLLTIQASAVSAVVVAAIQDLVNPHSRWLWPLALTFGLANGLSIGERFLSEASFAGSYVALGLLAWLIAIELGQVWVIALLASAAGLLRRRGLIAQLAVLALALFAGHTSLHRLVDRSELLAELGAITLDRFLMILTLAWACLILCTGILEAILPARGDGLTRPSLTDAQNAENV